LSMAEEGDGQVARTLFWVGLGVGVAAVGALLVYAAVRLVSTRREDPTSQRIQQLIDEANSLLKALDDQRHSA
jgi:membrane protein implicated in regulation of membrane protease activity